MQKKIFISLLLLAVLIAASRASAGKNTLPERYKTWLDEEVVYIISPVEKEVFLKLGTDRERDLFIQAFWKQRDPTPGTEENEFRKEHYRRIGYANHFFGRGTPKAGWRTDRGRIYIILGDPNDIQRFEGKTQVYPTEVWFYQGLTKQGLPPGFSVVFFQEGGTGEYKLYSPLRDGPQGLMTSYFGDSMDYMAAYEQLREFEPDLAEVSLTLIPGERRLISGRPTMSSDILIQRIEGTPLREIKEKYAQKFLDYKDIVEVEYSANYIGSDSLVKVIKDSSGTYFVHYAIEPERLSVNQFEKKYYTTLMLNGMAVDQNGRTIYQFEKTISLEFNQDQIDQVSRLPLSIRDMFPLIPGEYRISILVKNEVSKEFTSIERDVFIPSPLDKLQMTSLLLGYRMIRETPQPDRLRPFQMGPYRLYVQSNRTFTLQDTLILSFQVHGLDQAMRERGEIKFTFLKNGEAFRSQTRPLSEYPDFPNIMESFPLREFLPAHYRVEVSLMVDRQQAISAQEEFDVTHAETMVRPWIYSKLLAGTGHPAFFYVLGTQFFNSGLYQEAKAQFEKAHRLKPEAVEYALSLAKVFMTLEEYGQVEPLLKPFMDQPQPPSYDVFFTLGKAYQNLGQLAEAIAVFDKAISHHGLNTTILNTLGECYFQLGKLDEALVVWERSLEINQDQPQIKKSVEAIKEKK